jgi:Mg2+ and Co2+ transporter CorA
MTDKKLVVDIPGPNAPGFLRRQKRALAIRERWVKDFSPDVIDELAKFLAEFVSQPADEAKAIEAILDASESQILEMLEAIGGGGAEVPPLKGGSSGEA